jgi:hypothetical protein
MDNADNEEDSLSFLTLLAATRNAVHYLLEGREDHQKDRERKTARQRTNEDNGEDKRGEINQPLEEKPAT